MNVMEGIYVNLCIGQCAGFRSEVDERMMKKCVTGLRTVGKNNMKGRVMILDDTRLSGENIHSSVMVVMHTTTIRTTCTSEKKNESSGYFQMWILFSSIFEKSKEVEGNCNSAVKRSIYSEPRAPPHVCLNNILW
ncbi:hypothetical protein KQX54_020762 [Cotesia glomerata]|uniref:Uncharacterized protein n=1 Tax=Cotesia glomerata TaxID=32391 RepID=A0AAV7J924_COTGL|nr:hypothetical protein KQX54_020762 [Cotesia glomerata]